MTAPDYILVGSQRPAKIDAVREALARVSVVDPSWARTRLEARSVGDSAPRMPLSDAETLDGARSRAAALWRYASSTGAVPVLCIGLEGGLGMLPSKLDRVPDYTIRTWACVTDGSRWSVGAGPSISLPDRIARAVLDGQELGDVVDALAGEAVRGTRGAWGVLTLDLLGRRDAFQAAVLAALAPFYNPSPLWSD